MVSKFARNYIQVIRLLHALDTDHDGIISAEEISHSAIVLKTLDKDHDGSLSPEECRFRGFPPGIGLLTGGNAEAAEQRRRFLLRVRPAFMRFHPILAALDADHDGQISASEIQNAPSALWTLDRNGDGQITEEEYLPDPVENELTIIMSHLDTDGDGKISREERLNPFAAGVRDLLDAADQDRTGVVTEQQLRNEIRWRADYNRDGMVTWSEMLRAMSAGAFVPVSHRECRTLAMPIGKRVGSRNSDRTLGVPFSSPARRVSGCWLKRVRGAWPKCLSGTKVTKQHGLAKPLCSLR